MTRTPSQTAPDQTSTLPEGVGLRILPVRRGRAGVVIDLLDRGRADDIAPVQWNFVSSLPDTLRGVHVHPRHSDYLCVLDGTMLLGLHDMRPDSATYRHSSFLTLRGDEPRAVTIPPGVAHGFYFPLVTEYAYAVDQYWDPADELGCRWNDPDLNLAWPAAAPLLSPRDREAMSYADLTLALAAQLTGPAHA